MNRTTAILIEPLMAPDHKHSIIAVHFAVNHWPIRHIGGPLTGRGLCA